MSVRCITAVLDKSQHSGTSLLMLVVLADYSDDDGNSYPAVASLARKCRMTPRNAQYILGVLQDSGELRVMKNEGPKGCNRYRIMLSSLGVVTPLKPTSPLKAASPLKPASGGGEAGFAKGVKPIAPEPSLNRQRTVSTRKRGTDLAELQDLLHGIDSDLVADWLRVRESKRATALTRTAMKGMINAAKRVGMTLEEAIRYCIEKNWIALRTEYMNVNGSKPAASSAWEGAR